ncbi:pentatricopeptide repeat-containing protein At4g18520, chloroplastic [Cryptomeria japonica]|uniref:pentatricopeptide repeat-containing protein At4g18520, chloroplastic n=1 Tax=Cryptomeria japonica TaxID=3369 RepID=UPI0025AD17E7|nr:pentatricopeptide repeat-containing protein At4g18520, chloroplastic [Cryptomeria japonica]
MATIKPLPPLHQENSPHVFKTNRNYSRFTKSKHSRGRQISCGKKMELTHEKDIVRLMDALNIKTEETHSAKTATCVFFENNQLSMHVRRRNLTDARHVFDKMPKRNKVSWSAMIAGYAENGFGEEALELFREMREEGMKPNHITFVSVLQACREVGDLEAGMQIHGWIVKNGFQSNKYLVTTLVDLYCDCGTLDDARHLFDEITERDVVSWTAMIARYSQQGHGEEALRLFNEMRQTDVMANYFTVPCVLKACSSLRDIQQGQGLHAYAIKIGVECDMFVGSALVDMYEKCGSLADARRVFNQIPQRDEILWNTMIIGCLHWGRSEQALVLLSLMHLAGVEPEQFIINGVMSACGSEEFNKIKMKMEMQMNLD